MLIIEQYRAIAGNLMLWALRPGNHPLRLILGGHLRNLSQCTWGYPDFTWVVSRGGRQRSQGSNIWSNVCLAWEKLKPLLTPVHPKNEVEWGHLPLGSPHCAQMDTKLARCKTQAQIRLREGGILIMQDVLSPTGEFLTWLDIRANHQDNAAHRAFDTLVGNLRARPVFRATSKRASKS